MKDDEDECTVPPPFHLQGAPNVTPPRKYTVYEPPTPDKHIPTPERKLPLKPPSTNHNGSFLAHVKCETTAIKGIGNKPIHTVVIDPAVWAEGKQLAKENEQPNHAGVIKGPLATWVLHQKGQQGTQPLIPVKGSGVLPMSGEDALHLTRKFHQLHPDAPGKRSSAEAFADFARKQVDLIPQKK